MRTGPEHRFSKGFTLVEAVVSAGIISSALLAVLGLLSASLSTARDTKHQAAANILAEQMANRVIHAVDPPVGGELIEIYDLSLRRIDVESGTGIFGRGSKDPAAIFMCRAWIDDDTDRSRTTGKRLSVTIEYPATATEGNRHTHRYVSRVPF